MENRAAVLSGKEKSYLFTIAYRLIIDHVRAASRFGSNKQLPLMPDSHGGEGFSDLAEIVRSHIDRLPAQQKTLVLLRDYEGYSYREIGTMTGLTETQVKKPNSSHQTRMRVRNVSSTAGSTP